MQKFRVLVEGKNLLMQVNGVQKRFGFFTTVYVDAFTPDDAKTRAIDLLREDARLQEASLNAENDPISYSAQEVNQMESFKGVRLPRNGLALYSEESDEGMYLG